VLALVMLDLVYPIVVIVRQITMDLPVWLVIVVLTEHLLVLLEYPALDVSVKVVSLELLVTLALVVITVLPARLVIVLLMEPVHLE